MDRVQYAGLEFNWVCLLMSHSCCVPKGINSLLGDRITVQPLLFLGVFEFHRGSHKVEVNEDFAASWNVQWKGHHL